jgi:predicted transcriptional regulator
MITKEKIIEAIKAMPEDRFEDIDVLLERLVILEKVEKGMKDIEESNVISHEEMKNKIDSWFKK